MTSTEAPTETWVPELTFGARLALVRHRMGWNIKEAAAACGVPAQSWRGWEIDGREPHRMVTIAMTIAATTGCDYRWLVFGPGRGESPNLLAGYSEPQVIAQIGDPIGRARPLIRRRSNTRAVSQTRPAGQRSRPYSPVPA